DPTQKIGLSTEIELQRTYLEIEQLRYEDLQVSFHVPDELLNAQVPALILQPVVENSVKYGVASAPPPASVEVKAWAVDRCLHLQVLDSGKGQVKAKSGGGIGLSNVLKRLRLIYGDDHAVVDAGRLESGEFRVELAFPLEFK